MPKTPEKALLTLLIEDQGAGLYHESGERLGLLPATEPGVPLGTLWGPMLRQLAPPGSEVQILLDHSSVLVQCQEVPFLSPKEQREVAERVFAAEKGAADLESTASLDPDPLAEGGHVLWLAALPSAGMSDLLGAIQGAGLMPVMAIPFERALRQGLDGLGPSAQDRLVLVAVPGAVGHLCFFHGRALVLQRSFPFPGDPADHEELLYEEVSRLLQFIKQKHRNVAFQSMEMLGLPGLSPAFRGRVRTALRLDLTVLAPALWPVLMEGIRRERGRKHGLNLLPQELQEAGRLRVFKGVFWVATAVMGLLFLGASFLLFSQELFLEREVTQAERLLLERETRTAEEARIVEARIPLLRVKLAERRQGEAAAALARLGTAVFEPPQGIQLENVEILQIPDPQAAHSFTVTGLAFTERSFSVGPLAQYLLTLGRQPGVTLEPLKQATISDRVVAGRENHLDQMAITRFTLKGVAR